MFGRTKGLSVLVNVPIDTKGFIFETYKRFTTIQPECFRCAAVLLERICGDGF